MADFTESLTIRIRGDSSEFSQELDRVSQRLSEFEGRLSGVESAGHRLDSMFQRWGQAVQPLNRISQALDGIRRRLHEIGNTPLNINVQPAMQSLLALQSQLALVLAQMRQLNSISLAGGFAGGGFGTTGFAQGGLVDGRPGFDRIPAMLSAGEFVIREASVRDLGVEFLSVLNNEGRMPASRGNHHATVVEAPARPSQVTNFGGISIQVNRSNDLGEILRELQAGGVRLKNQRG
ncbi:MAG TPA: hypothetical protein VLA12_01780 [Planctomycetaceae bacterium]|nr:hypothetical protein [Planctomycetaceae bacterium]